jgi:hypothetical protein
VLSSLQRHHLDRLTDCPRLLTGSGLGLENQRKEQSVRTPGCRLAPDISLALRRRTDDKGHVLFFAATFSDDRFRAFGWMPGPLSNVNLPCQIT